MALLTLNSNKWIAKKGVYKKIALSNSYTRVQEENQNQKDEMC